MNWNYIAGFFDADGSITYENRGKGHWELKFTNTDKKILQKIKNFIKAGKVYRHHRKRPYGKPCYDLRIARHLAVLRICTELLPRCHVKKERVKEAMKVITDKKWTYGLADVYLKAIKLLGDKP